MGFEADWFAFAVGAAFGAVIVFVATRFRAQAERSACAAAEDRTRREVLSLTVAAAELRTELQKERESWAEKLALQGQAEQHLTQAFRALSADALQSNNQQFLDLARTQLERFQTEAKAELEARQQTIGESLAPLKDSLARVDAQIQALETARVGAYQSLSEQLRQLVDEQRELRSHTSGLVKALRQPNVRGRWGEIQLRRVVELAGMLNYCDFIEQESIDTEDGRLRPDLLVKLPGGRNVVVDSKAPLAAYLEALEATDDETRKAYLADHARQIRAHIGKLSRKSYWDQFQPTPQFVVLFIPGEVFYNAALEADPALIEAGVDQSVLIATPTSLIGLLRAVAFGWREEQIARNAREISALGKELHTRLSTLGEHWAKVGRGLRNAVESYNDASASLESRVLVTARRFRDLDTGVSEDEIPEASRIELAPRQVQAEELLRRARVAALPSQSTHVASTRYFTDG